MTAPRSDRDGVTQAINALTEAGWTVVEVEGQEVANPAEAIAEAMGLDDAWVAFHRENMRGGARFVLGNDPDEVLADYTMNLDDVLGPLTDSWIM